MNLETLNLFVDVMRHGSFAEVARTRGVAPSSISRAVATLEDELGIRLFQRSTRKLEPTEAGMIYFERVETIIDELDAARHVAMDVSEEPRGTLRVTAPAAYGDITIVPLLPQLAARFPRLSIELLLTDANLDLLEERIDVAIRLGSLKNSSYIAKRLDDMVFHICATPEYLQQHGTPQTPKDITKHRCLLFPRPGYSLDWLFKDRDGNINEVPINGNYLITHSGAIKQCILAGMGLSLLPDWLVKAELSRGELVSLFPEYEVTATDYENAVWILYPSRKYLPLKTRSFINFLSAHFEINEARSKSGGI